MVAAWLRTAVENNIQRRLKRMALDGSIEGDVVAWWVDLVW